MPNATSTPATKTCRRGPRLAAVGAGIEPAHALEREPRFRRGAIPFRSSYLYNQFGGDDPIRTDGAFKGHSALAVRRLSPLGHASFDFLVGMERFELSCTRRWFLRPVCIPVPPHPHDLLTSCNLDTRQTSRFLSANPSTTWWAPRDLNPENVTALEAAASANSARSPQK